MIECQECGKDLEYDVCPFISSQWSTSKVSVKVKYTWSTTRICNDCRKQLVLNSVNQWPNELTLADKYPKGTIVEVQEPNQQWYLKYSVGQVTAYGNLICSSFKDGSGVSSYCASNVRLPPQYTKILANS